MGSRARSTRSWQVEAQSSVVYDVRISYMQVYQDSAFDLIGAPLNTDNKGETLPRIVLLDDVRLCGRSLTQRRRA